MASADYLSFIERKGRTAAPVGFTAEGLSHRLFAYQREVVSWAVERGNAALFLDTGLGKTFCQIEWAEQCVRHTGKPALILAPLAVGEQTVREAKRFGHESTRIVREQSDVRLGLNVTNYHRLELFDPTAFGAVVLDESSILKSFVGSTKRALCEAFNRTPHRLACTATPAPNDYMEIGNHSEFLGVLPSRDMLSRWFIVDSMDMGKYRVKGHAVEQFWSWVASWAVCAMHPSDLGHPEEDFNLPSLDIIPVEVGAHATPEETGTLVPDLAVSATELGKVRRATLDSRVAQSVELVKAATGPVIVWCQGNDESRMIAKALTDAVEVTGSEPHEAKERKLLAFSNGEARVIVTKPSIAGYGLNWQHCATQVFSSINYSYEQFYQAIRRSWRFGQLSPVNVYVVISDSESGVMQTIERKRLDHDKMKDFMRMANFRSRDVVIANAKERFQGKAKASAPRFLQ